MAPHAFQSELDLTAEYRDERVKIPILITLVLTLLAAAPLGYWIMRINQEGDKANNVAHYQTLVELVAADVQTVSAILRNDSETLAALKEARKKPIVTLVVPEIVIVEEKKEPDGPEPLNVELDGIYWSPSTPLVGLNGETYRVGDTIQEHKIISIGKTKVMFRATDGTLIEKDMYEDLLKNQR